MKLPHLLHANNPHDSTYRELSRNNLQYAVEYSLDNNNIPYILSSTIQSGTYDK